MSYKALLFCSEASSARVITQVLSELDFECQPCEEPFAAVKKLTSEQFDAIVIDCSNEQDAALLVKSARNSSFNQQALLVAVVDGKNGVVSAFRLGANLVLAKPVSLEQAKSTLRMARGLLHKSDLAKAAAATAQSAGTSEPAAVMPAPAMPQPPAVPPASWEPAAAVAAPPASILEVEAEPAPVLEPAEAGVLESVPEPTSSQSAPSAWPAAVAQKSVWEKVSESVTPMASSLLEAEETVSEAEPEAMPAECPSAPPLADGLPARPLSTHSVDAGGESAQGAAVARARIPAAESSASGVQTKAVSPQSHVPATLSKLAEPKPESNTVKWLAAVLLFLALSALGYMGWTRLHPSSAAPPAPRPASPAPSTPPSSSTASGPGSSLRVDAAASQPGLKSTTAQSATVPSPGKQTESAPKSATNAAASVPPARAPEPQEVLVVSNRPAAASGTPNPPAEPAPDVPAPVQLSDGSQSQPIPSLVYSSTANAPTPALANYRISQGVAQGLLTKRVQPVYPPQAVAMHLQGAVQLLATISKDGNVTNLKQVAGDPVLGHAAMDAVKQWKYKPYLLNGEPLEIQTEITVNFKPE